MERIKTDILVIGAGSGGLSVAAGASQMGADVTLLESHKMGGDCLNYGCVPSKALIASAKAAHLPKHAAAFGVTSDAPDVSYSDAMAHVRNVIETIEPVDSQERFEGFGVRVIREKGRFVSPTEVEAGGYRITARRIVLATGSRPMVPPIPGLQDVPFDTNETLFERTSRPDDLIIIGAGPIGMEMAQAHLRLGSNVTVIDAAQAMGPVDREAAELVLDTLRQEGLNLIEGTGVARVDGKAGAIVVQLEDGRSVKGSDLLLAVGRKSNVEDLNLDAAGIKTHPRGIKVDASLRTSNRRVYAIGDVAGGAQFTHVAGYQAGVIIRSLLFGLPAKARTDHVPWAIYTDPEIAQVGMSEAEARKKHGRALEIARFDYAHNDRAIAERKTRGFAKVMVVKGRPVGVTIAGAQAGELISLWALALANRMKMSQVVGMIAPYPTVSEVNKRLAGAYFAPKLFESSRVKTVVRAVQRWLP